MIPGAEAQSSGKVLETHPGPYPLLGSWKLQASGKKMQILVARFGLEAEGA